MEWFRNRHSSQKNTSTVYSGIGINGIVPKECALNIACDVSAPLKILIAWNVLKHLMDDTCLWAPVLVVKVQLLLLLIHDGSKKQLVRKAFRDGTLGLGLVRLACFDFLNKRPWGWGAVILRAEEELLPAWAAGFQQPNQGIDPPQGRWVRVWIYEAPGGTSSQRPHHTSGLWQVDITFLTEFIKKCYKPFMKMVLSLLWTEKRSPVSLCCGTFHFGSPAANNFPKAAIS